MPDSRKQYLFVYIWFFSNHVITVTRLWADYNRFNNGFIKCSVSVVVDHSMGTRRRELGAAIAPPEI